MTGDVSVRTPAAGVSKPSPISVSVKADMYKPVGYMQPKTMKQEMEEREEELAIPYRYTVNTAPDYIKGFKNWPLDYRQAFMYLRDKPYSTIEELSASTGLNEDDVNSMMTYLVDNGYVKVGTKDESERMLEITVPREERYGVEYTGIAKRKQKKGKTKSVESRLSSS